MNAVEKIHSLDKFGSRPGLDRVMRLLDELGNPQDELKFIHVAGTNGKGSTCQLISSVLTSAGYKTGLFISPYIIDFRERIQINGEMISEELLSDAVERTFPILERLASEDCVITEFEYVNALEFLIHEEAGCDVVVLETGMGGLLDSTNVIKPPLCSVITSIGLDHTAILGDTLEKIALQKCGIIKPGSVAVTSPQSPEVIRTIERDCSVKGVKLLNSADVGIIILKENLNGTLFEYKNNKLLLPLLGDHQLENAKTALVALEVVRQSLPFSDESLCEGFKNAKNPARFELLGENPPVILDGAHNPDGVNALKNALNKYNDRPGVVAVLGMLADKDSSSSIEILCGSLDAVFTAPVCNPRTMTSEALAEKCRPYFSEVEACSSAFEAFDKAFEYAKKHGFLLLVAGSLYMASELRPYILNKF